MHDDCTSGLETTKGFGGGRVDAVHGRVSRQMKEMPDAVKCLHDDRVRRLVGLIHRTLEGDGAGGAIDGRRLLPRVQGRQRQQHRAQPETESQKTPNDPVHVVLL